jgi:hypothetical protein
MRSLLKRSRAVVGRAGPMGYLPEIFRTIFKITQNPTMPTINAATAVKTVVAVVVIVEGSANVGPLLPPLLWAKAEATPTQTVAITATTLLTMFLTMFIFSFRLPQSLRRKRHAGNKRLGV